MHHPWWYLGGPSGPTRAGCSLRGSRSNACRPTRGSDSVRRHGFPACADHTSTGNPVKFSILQLVKERFDVPLDRLNLISHSQTYLPRSPNKNRLAANRKPNLTAGVNLA